MFYYVPIVSLHTTSESAKTPAFRCDKQISKHHMTTQKQTNNLKRQISYFYRFIELANGCDFSATGGFVELGWLLNT